MGEISTGSSTRWGELIELRMQQLIQIALLGVVLGLATWILTLLVRQVVLVPLFCGDPAAGLCVNATDTAGNIASIVSGIAALLGLVRLSVYRPLLIALAVTISLWGFGSWVAQLLWFESIAWAVLLHTAAYVLFSWLVRPRSFLPAIILVVVAVLIVRLVPML